MRYATKYHEASGFCTVTVSGLVQRPGDSIVLQKLTRDIGEQEGCSRFLIDMREATVSGSTLETYETGVAPTSLGMDPVRFRVALLYGPTAPDAGFLEDVLVNRHFNVRVFTDDVGAAEQWLAGKRPGARAQS